MNVAGNFSVSGGTLTVNGATTGTSNAAVINVAGNFSHTAGYPHGIGLHRVHIRYLLQRKYNPDIYFGRHGNQYRKLYRK